MNYILIKEGDHRPNSFSDLAEAVNRNYNPDLDMYTRVDYGLRLVMNESNLEPDKPLALTHYHVNTSSYFQNPEMYRPIDTDLMMSALDTYDYVLFGVPSVQSMQSDYTLITSAAYIGRTHAGQLINIETSEHVKVGDGEPRVIVLFGMVKMKNLPFYQIIMDPKLVHATDINDGYHEKSGVSFRFFNDSDGSVKSNIFAPVFEGAVKYGDTLLALSDEVRIRFFNGHDTFLDTSNAAEWLETADVTVSSSHSVRIEGSDVVVSGFTGGVGFIHVDFNCGLYYNVASEYEKPSFRYLIVGSNGNKHS